jgi:hypothetical protein
MPGRVNDLEMDVSYIAFPFPQEDMGLEMGDSEGFAVTGGDTSYKTHLHFREGDERGFALEFTEAFQVIRMGMGNHDEINVLEG